MQKGRKIRIAKDVSCFLSARIWFIIKRLGFAVFWNQDISKKCAVRMMGIDRAIKFAGGEKRTAGRKGSMISERGREVLYAP